MSSRKSRYRDEATNERKKHKKSENRKEDSLEGSFQYKSKEKKHNYESKDERIRPEVGDYGSDFNRKKRNDNFNTEKSMTPESDDNFVEQRRKSKKKVFDENVRLDKENDHCITNYNRNEKVTYDKKADKISKNKYELDKNTKKYKKKDKKYSKNIFEEEHGRKRDREKDRNVQASEHHSKHTKYDKQVEQNKNFEKHCQERYSSGEENSRSQHRTDRIRSSVHKIEKVRDDSTTNDEQNDTDSNDNYQKDSKSGTHKYKSRYHEADDEMRKSKKQYLEPNSSDDADRTDHNRLKIDRIRSSVHKIENKSKSKKQNAESWEDMDYDNYEPKRKFKYYDFDNDRSRQSDKSYDDYSNKRKRDYVSEIERLDEKNSKERYNRREVRVSQENLEHKLESKAPSGSTDVVVDSAEPLSKRQKIGNINMRTGGAYIPPAKLRMMQESIKDKGSEEYQRIAWEALKKSIVGMTNKVNSSNITEIIPELFKENIIRGRGVLARAIMQAQAASPTFTRVYAALVAIINTKFPEIGELILNRLIIQYKRGFRRNDKTICMTAARFIAQLLNQEVAHEVLILEIVTHLLETPTEDSVEIAIATLKECGKKLTQLTPKGMRAITQRVRDVLHEAAIDMRVRYMIEVFFAVQKDGFKDFEVIPQELDLVEEDDKYTHLINLDEAVDAQDMLNVFKFDPDYLENEEKYKSVVNEILGESSDESGNESDDESEEDEEKEGDGEGSDQKIIDMTETNLVCLRRKIYLTIQSSLDFEECAHKLLKLELKPGQILEMCYMILDCCAQQRTYEKFYGLLAQRFCQLNKIYVEPFTEIFDNSYKTIHRLETNKLRNVAKFFAHLLYTDAISWNVLSIIKLNEDDTTSSSRIFIKILFQELCEYMGLPKLNERVKDVTLQEAFEGLFPRDHPHNTRFAINFFTSIGLGGLTDELREHLINLPKNPAPLKPDVADISQSSSSSSTSSSSSSSSSSDSD